MKSPLALLRHSHSHSRSRLALAALLAAFSALTASAYSPQVENLLQRVDSTIAQSDIWEGKKRLRIADLLARQRRARSADERYWANKDLYEEYAVYDADSAMAYAERNYQMALARADLMGQRQWRINRSFLLAATGLLKESLDEIATVSAAELSPELRTVYYNQMAYLYSHFGQYLGKDSSTRIDYYLQSSLYQDSTYLSAAVDDPLYPLYRAWAEIDDSNPSAATAETFALLHADVDGSRIDTRADAMKAYALSRLYANAADADNRMKYLALSAIADIRSANKDIASLEELGRQLHSDGDIDRAYRYINYCQQRAQSYRNRVRAVGLASLENSIHQAYAERNAEQQSRLHATLAGLACVALLLAVVIALLLWQNRRYRQVQAQLSAANADLKGHLSRLSQLQAEQDATNSRLTAVNDQLSTVNSQLNEANFIKEECVGHMFTMCSNYINKLDSLRRSVLLKLKARQLEELNAMVNSPMMVQNELKEFFNSFDAIFLNIYPDFVKDFNELLRPEERLSVRDGDSLTTDLRIYALVRLGITDSVKIAALLHCSPQTVYNNRLRIRNKAAIPKEKFAETVRSLGKYQQ